jgi:hypothetical protein
MNLFTVSLIAPIPIQIYVKLSEISLKLTYKEKLYQNAREVRSEGRDIQFEKGISGEDRRKRKMDELEKEIEGKTIKL